MPDFEKVPCPLDTFFPISLLMLHIILLLGEVCSTIYKSHDNVNFKKLQNREM